MWIMINGLQYRWNFPCNNSRIVHFALKLELQTFSCSLRGAASCFGERFPLYISACKAWGFSIFANITWFSSVKWGCSLLLPQLSWMIPPSPSCLLVLFQASLLGKSPGNSNLPVISSLGPQRREKENGADRFWMWRARSELQGIEGSSERVRFHHRERAERWGVDLPEQSVKCLCRFIWGGACKVCRFVQEATRQYYASGKVIRFFYSLF